MLSLHIKKAEDFEACDEDSGLYWVRDGVVIQWERLPLTEGAIALSAFTSAEGLQETGKL